MIQGKGLLVHDSGVTDMVYTESVGAADRTVHESDGVGWHQDPLRRPSTDSRSKSRNVRHCSATDRNEQVTPPQAKLLGSGHHRLNHVECLLVSTNGK